MSATADYPPEWQSGEIQARIRELANYTCEICGTAFKPGTNEALEARDSSGRPILGHVHHLDHEPSNCADENLIFLCQSCHIRLHGQGWTPGDQMPLAWGNEPPAWVLRRGLTYRPNPMVASLQELARYATRKEDRAQFLIGLIESQGWITGAVDPLAEMRALLQTVLNEYEMLLDQRQQAAQGPLLAEAAQWASAQGFLGYEDALRCSGLDGYEFTAALQQGLLAPETGPFTQDFIPPYFDPTKLNLNTETRLALLKSIRLTREQAADLLGVPVAVFEGRRREAGIRHVTGDSRRERLYRKIDVEKLRR